MHLPFWPFKKPPLPPPDFRVDGAPSDPDTWRALLEAHPPAGAERPSAGLHREFVRLRQELARQHIDLKTVTVDGRSLLAQALACRADWAIAPLLSEGVRPLPGEPFLMDIVERLPGHWKRAWLVRTGINERTETGETLLHRAAARAKRSMVSDLLAAGADATATDGKGRTPLHAVWQGAHGHRGEADAVAQVLLAAGARWDTPDAQGETPFHALLRTFPRRRLPPESEMATAAGVIDAATPEGTHPLGLLLRASRADHLRAAAEPSGRGATELLPWLKWLDPFRPNPLSLTAEFDSWCLALDRRARRSDVVAAVSPLWRSWELRAALPETAAPASVRPRL